jgi:hypothetical protein
VTAKTVSITTLTAGIEKANQGCRTCHHELQAAMSKQESTTSVLGFFQDKADATEKWLEAEGKQRIIQSQIEKLNLKK